MLYKNITFCCKNCGNKIDRHTAFYGLGTCKFCARIGKKHSKQTRLKIGKAHKGKIISKKYRLKISKSLIGKYRGKKHPCFGTKHSEETRLKMSKAGEGKRRGKDNCNWRGGISFFPYPKDFSKDLKLKIRCRDNHICQNCGISEDEYVKKCGKVLSIHHINYDKQNCKEINLITVCSDCNLKANYNRDYWLAYYNYKMDNLYVI